MATIKNPIDRKRKTSFLLGMVVMGVVTVLVAAGLFVLYTKKDKELKDAQAKITTVGSVLRTSKVAAEEIKSEDLGVGKIVKDNLNAEVAANLYEPISDEGGKSKAFAKIDLPAGTILTKDMVYHPNNDEEDKVNNTLRLYDVVGLTLPSNLKEGDVIDIRFLHPSLPDFVVLAKKRVEKADTDTVWLTLTESEIILLSSATLESYLTKGSKMYATIYTDPGVQEAAKITYPINQTLIPFLNIAVDENNRQDGVFKQLSELGDGKFAEVRGYFAPGYGLSSEEEIRSTLEAGVNKDKSIRERKRADFIQAELAEQ